MFYILMGFGLLSICVCLNLLSEALQTMNFVVYNFTKRKKKEREGKEGKEWRRRRGGRGEREKKEKGGKGVWREREDPKTILKHKWGLSFLLPVHYD